MKLGRKVLVFATMSGRITARGKRSLLALTLSQLLGLACSKEHKDPALSPKPLVVSESPIDAAAVPAIADAAPKGEAIHTVSLQGREPVPVPDTPLTVFISQSSHKIRAPLAMVSVLVAVGEQKTEVGWRIESSQIDGEWRALQGRRYDSDSSKYVEEEIPGWLVRLDSIDKTSANASPKHITVSFKRTPLVQP